LQRSSRVASAERVATASGRSLADREERSGKREGKEATAPASAAAATAGVSSSSASSSPSSSPSLQRNKRQPCRCGATRRGAAQTATRYVKVGHPARTTPCRAAAVIVAGFAASLMLLLADHHLRLWERDDYPRLGPPR